MTQEELILDVLEDGVQTTKGIVKSLGIKRTSVTAALVKLQRTGQVVSVAKSWPRLYHLTGKRSGFTFREPDDLFNIQPSITKCSYCKKTITKKTRKVERRETREDGAIQLWGFCKPCFEVQKKSRKIPVDAVVPHISTLAPNTTLFQCGRLRRPIRRKLEKPWPLKRR